MLKHLTYSDNTLYVSSTSQVTEDCKDNNSSKEWGEGVTNTNNEGVSVTIVVELVVTGQDQLTPVPNWEGEKYLGSCSTPNLI